MVSGDQVRYNQLAPFVVEYVSKPTTICFFSLILKTSDEIEAEKLEQTIKKSILEIVKKRKANMGEGVDEFGSDYLGQLVKIADESNGSKRISIEQMIDEIKAVYGAGHLTTTNLLSWTVFLLAIDQDWQEKARREVFEFFGRRTPTSDGIARLKTVRNCFLRVFSLNIGVQTSLCVTQLITTSPNGVGEIRTGAPRSNLTHN